ncbi:MAG: hypothetical protein ABSE40_19905, partial [Candidatus Sulfotelmatobacter sp.]
SICRSIVTICSGLYLWMGMTCFSSKWILSHSTWYKFRRSGHTTVLGSSFDRLCWMAKGLCGPGSTQVIVLSDSLEFTDCIEGGQQQSVLLTRSTIEPTDA